MKALTLAHCLETDSAVKPWRSHVGNAWGHAITILLATVVMAATFGCQANPAETPHYSLTKTFPVGGDGGWDCATVDPAACRLYVARGTHTQVIDTRTGKLVADISGMKRAHGVAIVPELNRGFITDGGAANVVVFDLKTDAVLGKIPAAPDADIVVYDKPFRRVLLVCGDAHRLIWFAPDVDVAAPKSESLDLGGDPEFLAPGEHGNVFVNLSDKSEIAVVSIADQKVVARYPLAPGEHPTGLAFDRADGLLFSACRNGKLVVLHAADGRIETVLPIGAGVDGAAFVHGMALASCGDGTLAIVRKGSDGHWVAAATVPTAPSARTMAVDDKTGTVYLPAADVEPVSGSTAHGRSRPVPGTFKILVVTPAAR